LNWQAQADQTQNLGWGKYPLQSGQMLYIYSHNRPITLSTAKRFGVNNMGTSKPGTSQPQNPSRRLERQVDWLKLAAAFLVFATAAIKLLGPFIGCFRGK
jgi:hypothetical protein